MLFYFVLEKSKGWGLRMNRPPKTKLVVALGGALLALSAVSANAAGLGKLSINSALGQPLSAEIELVSLQPGEFESISARVASAEAYSDARVEYSPLLRQLRFAAERRSDGKPILKITSAGPLNEPFLDVLVEMTWPAGRLLREYPILLDPPGFNEARVAPPASSVATVTPVRPSTPVEPQPPASTSTPPSSAPSTTTPPSATVTTSTPSAKSESGGDTYGPVKKGDTLNKIAQEMKSDTVSLEQMLVALYRENKDAFIDNNMNRLRTGQILKVPAASDVAQITEKEARSEIRAQVANWNNYREQVAGAAGATPARADTATNVSTGNISTAKPDVTVPAPTAKDQLKIAKNDTSAGGKAGGPGAAGNNLQEQINALKEEKIAREKALGEANSRVKDLEKQIADMRRLLELKGAAGKADAKPDAKTAEPVKPADTKVAQVTPPPAKVEPPKPADAKPDAAKPADAKTEPPKTDTKPGDTKPAEAKPADAKPADAKPAETKPAEAAKPPAPKPAVKTPPPPPPEPSFIDEYGLPLGAGLVALFGIGALFAFMSRRKKKNANGNTSMSRTSSIMPSDLKPNTATGNRGGLVDTGNSSFLTDFDKTGPGSIDTDEVDPVAEAEVYIAYGRDAQAEEILKEAMSRDKSRHEITVKLLEIYHARKSTQAFETVARELKDTIGADNPMWAKVAAMGASIDPQNPLYGGSGQAYQTTGAFAAGGAAMIAAGAAEAEKAPPDLDFDLGFDTPVATSAPTSTIDITAPNTDQPAAASSLDFDLDLNSASSAPAETSAASDGLDFDLALDSTVATPAASAPAAPAAEASGFDFDLSSLSLDSADAKSGTAGGKTPEHDKTAALNLGDLSLDLDTPAPAGGSGGDGPSAVSTKLELAKAYIEIGDSDGAKEILNEVAREGSPAQQDEAKKILAGL